MQDKNEQRWLALWKRIGAQGNPYVVYNDLIARYSESHRAYHTLDHIGHCLDELDWVRDIVTDPNALELAIWYHDVIYDTKAKDNEEQSAAFARKVLESVLVSGDLAQQVADLVIASKHRMMPIDHNTQFFVDIDLAILGQSEEKFDEYELRIRKEYEWVPKDAFIIARSAILRSFLSRSSIYGTQFFRDKYEAQARRNIERSLR